MRKARSPHLISVGSNPIALLPERASDFETAHCLMFYEYAEPFSADWIEAVELLFAQFGEQAAIVTSRIGGKPVRGGYKRAKGRLARALENASSRNDPDIRIDSEHITPDDAFFPCRMRVTFSTSIGKIRQGVIAVRTTPRLNLSRMVDIVAPVLFSMIGRAYAHAFDFPAAYGPDFYLSSVGAVLRGESGHANRGYNKRITQWRDRTWHEQKEPSQGYLREVYPINFLLAEQLQAWVFEKRLGEYATSVGELHKCNFCDNLYRWEIDHSELDDVRRYLEHSGLILSAPAA